MKMHLKKSRTAIAAAVIFSALFAFSALSGCSSEKNGESLPSEYLVADYSTADPSQSGTSAGEAYSADGEENNKKDDETAEPMYDVAPVVKAYLSGDASSLSGIDEDIYEKACGIISEIITDDMDDYEKELAVHDYLIYNCTYDTGSLSAIPVPSENCDNPYGALINGKAICKGYTSTFRMFMGMLGIPCGTVHSCDTDGDEHAWNTVQLDGSWYYVDCTWDDPVPDRDGRLVTHEFFNISYEKISERHVLPEGSPQTDSIENSYQNRSVQKINDFSEIAEAVKKAYESKHNSVVLLFDESLGVDLSGQEPDMFFFPQEEEYFKKTQKELGKLSLTANSAQIAETEHGTAVEIIFSKKR